MNTSLETASGNIVDWFMGVEPYRTDWDAFFASIDKQSPDTILAEIKALEPMPDYSEDYARLTSLQHQLRLVLRHRKGLPLYSETTCPECGTRKCDAVLESCLPCSEKLPQIGSRGSCYAILPTRDIRTGEWGLVLYRADYSRHRKDVFLVWLALGFSSQAEALRSLYPIQVYRRWYARKAFGLDSVDVDDIIQLSNTMHCELPLNPGQFREFIREQLEAAVKTEASPGRRVIASAIRELERSKSR